MKTVVTPSPLLGYSKLYLDYLSCLYSARHFYTSDDLEKVAGQLDTISYNRQSIADILVRQNTVFGAGERTFSHIEQLRNEQAVCVIAGQQACLFGGPLLILLKALAVVKAAKLYEVKLQRPVIPMFWIAGDDHDFEEVNHTYVLNRQTELVKVVYDAPPEVEIPVADILFSHESALETAKQQLQESLGQTDFTDELYDIIDNAYTPSDTFVTAFGKLLAKLTQDYGLVLFSPGDREVKHMAVPLFEMILAKQNELHNQITTTNEHILRHGYHIQVEKPDNATHLFCNRHGRKPVLRDGERFVIGEESFHYDELLTLIRQEPELFSPDVMTRPVLQSYLLPVLSQKGGPSEIAYLAQVNPLFAMFGLIPPYYMARPSVTIIEKRYQKMMEEYQITFEELAGDIEQVINRVLALSFPADLDARFELLRNRVKQLFSDFVKESLKFEPALESFAHQTYGKIDYTVKQFEAKVFASHKRKSKETRERIYRLWHTVYTNRGLQERTMNPAYFFAKHGLGFVSFLYEQLDSEEKSHQLVFLSDYKVK